MDNNNYGLKVVTTTPEAREKIHSTEHNAQKASKCGKRNNEDEVKQA